MRRLESSEANDDADVLIVVLIKDFDTAKTRLAAALDPHQRRIGAITHARRAIEAALEVAPTLAICGSADAAALASDCGCDFVLEENPSGQNLAASTGLYEASRRGFLSALILSSDLPLISADAIREMLTLATATSGPIVIAAAATGRLGTNALLVRPPEGFGLHFGDASLPRFAAEAKKGDRAFHVHHSQALALDIDEPADLDLLAAHQRTE